MTSLLDIRLYFMFMLTCYTKMVNMVNMVNIVTVSMLPW